MNRITTEQLYDFYIDTANRCSSSTTSLSDEEIGYNLFEEFDVGVCSFFSDEALGRLLDAGMIAKEAVLISQQIRGKWVELEKINWTIDEVKTHPSWKCLFSLCDDLGALLEKN